MPEALMRTPRTLDLELTSRCNASCAYCYYLNNPGINYTDLPTERWLELFAELGRGQVMSVTLMGGEPLMRPDFMQLVDGIVANRMRFVLLTNGLLVTRALAEQLKATRRCDLVQVSLDGATAEAHESLRGSGTFRPALDAIRTLHAVGLPVTVRVTIHPGNLDSLPEVARLLLDDIGLPSFSTNSASSLGSSAKYETGTFLTTAQRLQAMRVLAELDLQYPDRIQADAGPLADWHMFSAMEDARKKQEPIPGRGRLVACRVWLRMTMSKPRSG